MKQNISGAKAIINVAQLIGPNTMNQNGYHSQYIKFVCHIYNVLQQENRKSR